MHVAFLVAAAAADGLWCYQKGPYFSGPITVGHAFINIMPDIIPATQQMLGT